ncbi:MAG: NUDIX domain-containing protein [Nocardioidaceae bacterium]|nr:NUDIX domain-containing protein [Nocardioidaceae bacterium]
MSEPPKPLRVRPAARGVVTDRDRRVLLVHFEFPWDENLPGGLWACPGGGLDPGESEAEGLKRELEEELGLVVSDVGSPVWHKEHIFRFGDWDGQRDTYFWLEVDAFDPRPQFSEAELRAENVDGMRWWTYDEVQAAQRLYDADEVGDPAYVVFSPRRLGHLLYDLLEQGHPAEPQQIDPL